jgi:hypothetical protein
VPQQIAQLSYPSLQRHAVIYRDACSDVDEAFSHGQGDDLSPVRRARPAEGRLYMLVDGSLGDGEK